MAKQERSILQEAIDEMSELISDKELTDFTKSYMSIHPKMIPALKQRNFDYIDNV